MVHDYYTREDSRYLSLPDETIFPTIHPTYILYLIGHISKFISLVPSHSFHHPQQHHLWQL